jgi:hypothetical protein
MPENTNTKVQPCPFAPAATRSKPLKMLLWGASGSGKTTLALQFPSPVLIDMEGGADLYGDKFKYDVIRTNNVQQVRDSVTWLRTSKHQYKTVILDPVTALWDEMQFFWGKVFLERNTNSKNNKGEYFDLGLKEWNTIKKHWHDLMSDLIMLDTNVIIAAREKQKFDSAGGASNSMVIDSEKSTEYLVDVVLHLYKENGNFMALCQKDRTGKLPTKSFTCDFATVKQNLNTFFKE